MSIGWQPSMETGAPLLDAQRRTLVERADALVATIVAGGDRPTVERALRDFGDYSVRHFSTEEDCHLRGVCPALQWNGAARADLIKIMSSFRGAFERDGASPGVAEDLACELSGWVARYIPGPVTTLPCVATPK
jgi:hemerythrin-like metal-binding protein